MQNSISLEGAMVVEGDIVHHCDCAIVAVGSLANHESELTSL